jgi:D-alanyl-D-alanine carboxypeptidase
MKKTIITGIIALLTLAQCRKYEQQTNTSTCDVQVAINPAFSKADTVQKILEYYIKQGVPGAVVAVYSPSQGWWATAKGLAKVENNTPVEICHLQYLQSISKSYMAVGILRLYEQGKIKLDAPITDYLPAKYSHYIDNASTITVRMLLNHTSGVPEYSDVPEYITYLLQHPNHVFSSEEFLSYIEKEKLSFTPGSKFSYTNTNYHLLALLADAVTGDHAKLIDQTVFKPLGLQHTFYRNDPNYINYPSLVNSYLDRYSNGIIENVSQMQQANMLSSKGDDGIVATPLDAVKFLKGLMEGKLLSPATMKEMMTWVNDDKNNPVYGLGLYNVRYSGQTGYGHGGAGIGAGCGLYYFPESNIYVFLGTNIGTLIDGPIVEKIGDMKNELIDVLLK